MNFAKFLRTHFTEHLRWLLLYFFPLIISGIADEVKILWNVNIQCDHSIQAKRPYMTVVNKDERNCIIIDIVVLGDIRVKGHEQRETGEISRFEKGNQEDFECEKCDSSACYYGWLGKHRKEIG